MWYGKNDDDVPDAPKGKKAEDEVRLTTRYLNKDEIEEATLGCSICNETFPASQSGYHSCHRKAFERIENLEKEVTLLKKLHNID